MFVYSMGDIIGLVILVVIVLGVIILFGLILFMDSIKKITNFIDKIKSKFEKSDMDKRKYL